MKDLDKKSRKSEIKEIRGRLLQLQQKIRKVDFPVIILFAGVIVGYFNVLELGFAAGVTKYVAQYMVLKDFDRLNNILNT